MVADYPLSRRAVLGATAGSLCLASGAALGEPAAGTVEHRTAYFNIRLKGAPPFIDLFAVDGLGRGAVDRNMILPAPGMTTHRVVAMPGGASLKPLAGGAPDWVFAFHERGFKVRGGGRANAPVLTWIIDPDVCHATMLGRIPARRHVACPALLHLPGQGSIRVSSGPSATVAFDAGRSLADAGVDNNPGSPRSFVSVGLSAGASYAFEVAAVYADRPDVQAPRYDGYRRNYLNVFQMNPRLAVLANNSASDPCAFTLYMSALMSVGAPPIAPGVRPIDLVGLSVDRYAAGMKAYGLVGYTDRYEGADTISWKSGYDSLDSWPSLVIAACTYARETGDRAWARARYAKIKGWLDRQLARDIDGDGLVEYELSGNSGSWTGGTRPANWWDTIGFGHKDAYSNALTYWALTLFADVAGSLGEARDQSRYAGAASKLKSVYARAFFNGQTGLIAGWRSRDGALHDYAFLFVNALAVLRDLVPPTMQHELMARLVTKMRDVGLEDFRYGLPGNLVPISAADYTTKEHRWGGPARADGRDGFQVYENGGATGCFAYFTIAALRKAGQTATADRIMSAMLTSYTAGAYQGRCENGMSRDWRSWTGACWGYEGFLADAYLPLLAAKED